MKKLMGILACALSAAVVVAGGYFPLSVTVPAGRTAVTNYIDMARIGAGQIDQISVATTGANTGGVAFASFDLGVAATAFASVGVTSTNTVFDTRPRWSASENVNVTNQLYSVRKIRVINTQISNGAAQVWEIGVYVK
jgi:hypothetical protein